MPRFRNAFGLSAALALTVPLLAGGPTLAQSNPSTASSDNTSSSPVKLGNKAPNGGLMKTHDDWRASSVVGATVYNDQGDSIGTVNDLLLSSDGAVQSAIISVGGFLGIGSKLVEVPFKNIKFAPSKSNPASGSKEATQANAPPTSLPATAPANSAGTAGTTGVPAPANGTTAPSVPATGLGAANNTGPVATSGSPQLPASQEYSLVLPGATKASLTSDPTFHY
jgi:sporulation protein YlmC with PRC-barrel domain